MSHQVIVYLMSFGIVVGVCSRDSEDDAAMLLSRFQARVVHILDVNQVDMGWAIDQ